LAGPVLQGGAAAPYAAPAAQNTPAAPAAGDNRRLLQLGPGDLVTISVFGRPEMDGNLYVDDDGTLRVPLAGKVAVGGLSPTEASEAIERALKTGEILVDPHVSITVSQSRSQRVSVLGEVRAPGRYAIESNTTILDLLAQAGGVTDGSANVIFILRPDASGTATRIPVDIGAFAEGRGGPPTEMLHGGDSVFVPKAEHFYITGEVQAPATYRVDPGMTVAQAIGRAGGVTPRGSESRVEIKRLGKDGKYKVFKPKPSDLVQADDVVRVKQSIF
jgi:polysaccharide export outer membrane protein